jgi:hypothetical protein
VAAVSSGSHARPGHLRDCCNRIRVAVGHERAARRAVQGRSGPSRLTGCGVCRDGQFEGQIRVEPHLAPKPETRYFRGPGVVGGAAGTVLEHPRTPCYLGNLVRPRLRENARKCSNHPRRRSTPYSAG